jgi:hypothetical protein
MLTDRKSVLDFPVSEFSLDDETFSVNLNISDGECFTGISGVFQNAAGRDR